MCKYLGEIRFLRAIFRYFVSRSSLGLLSVIGRWRGVPMAEGMASYNQFDAEAAGGGFFDEFFHLRTEGSTGGVGQG